jgi:hypothetical protein
LLLNLGYCEQYYYGKGREKALFKILVSILLDKPSEVGLVGLGVVLSLIF